MKGKGVLAGCIGATFLLQGGTFAATIDIAASDIGGQVTSDKGP